MSRWRYMRRPCAICSPRARPPLECHRERLADNIQRKLGVERPARGECQQPQPLDLKQLPQRRRIEFHSALRPTTA
jgi:hypothetical protein